MAFSQSALQAELYSVFNSMTDGDSHKFSKGISDAFKNFVDSGKPQTTEVEAYLQEHLLEQVLTAL